MVPHSRTPVRAHRLRPLNQPRAVVVELNEREMPVAVSPAPSPLHEAAALEPVGTPPSPVEPAPSQSRSLRERVERGRGVGGEVKQALCPIGRRDVETIGEIWRVDDEWWRQPISRRYIEVILSGGRHVVLYQDLSTGEWFEQSI